MTGFFSPLGAAPARTPNGPASGGRFGGAAVLQPCPLTVPLLCCLGRRGLQSESPHQVLGRLAQAHLPDRGPQVDHVPLLAAATVEAAEHVVVEVDAERPASAVACVDRP